MLKPTSRALPKGSAFHCGLKPQESEMTTMYEFRGYWGQMCFHTVMADNVDDAFAQLMMWAEDHWWCIDEPSAVLVIRLS